ncbi:MAG: hypothetical protein EAX91_16385 [Candidatus Lokiarchaeota archaeon]|nr:hypothetical protein [Candidatus Lokiarchaeota archaeon]
MKLNHYLLFFLKDNPSKILSIKFWCLTLLFIDAGIKVEMSDGYILTKDDCFNELKDILTISE